VPANRSKDRDEQVEAREIVLRSAISQETNAGDDDPVELIAEEGIQVSEDLFH
jgi:hypothetical protein